MASRPKSRTKTTRSTARRARKPSTIDLQAKDVSAASDKAGSDANTTQAANKPDVKLGRDGNVKASSAKSADKKPGETRTASAAGKQADAANSGSQSSSGGFIPALVGGAVTVLGLGAIGQFDSASSIPLLGSLYGGTSNSSQENVDTTQIAELRDEIKKLSSGAVDLGPVEARIAALEEKNSGLQNEITGRLKTLETSVSDITAAEGKIDPSELADRLSKLEAGSASVNGSEGVSELAEKFAALSQNVTELKRTVGQSASALSGSDGKLTALDQKIAEISAAVADLKTGIENNASNVDTLIAQSEGLTETVASVKASEKVARSVAVNALATALENDDSLSLPIASLEALIGETDETKRLAVLAEAGVPSRKVLAESLEQFTAKVQEPDAQGADATLSDKFWANAQKLVSFRSSGPREGDDPLAILSRVKAAVQADDLTAARAEWQKLSADLQKQGGDWREKLDMRREAFALQNKISSQLVAEAG